MRVESLIKTYPRKRLPLSEAHQKIYEEEYKCNRHGQTFFTRLAQKTEAWMHQQIAKAGKEGSILEIGAGTLNHISFEPEEKAHSYDIIEPFVSLYQGSPHLGRVRNVYKDFEDVPKGISYDRILSIAVLEHLTDLAKVVARSGLLLEEDGIFQHGIPSEGGMAWGLGWRLTTGLSFRLRTGLSYATLMRHEHVNTASEILAIVSHFFETVKIKRFPLPGHHFSFYTYLHATKPRLDSCSKFL